MEDLKRFEKKNSEGKKYYFFKSMNDLVNIVENHRSTDYLDASEDKDFTNWYKTNDMDEALDLYKYGWSEGTKELNQKIKLYNYKMEFKNEYSMVGSHVSVPRYLNGHPQSMIRRTQIERKDNVINLVRFSSILGEISGNRLVEEGAKFVALVQNLEAQGYRCNVDVVFASDRSYNDYHFVRVRIKSSNERLNIAKMSFPMCHPSMFRRFIFKLRWIEYGTCDNFRSWNMSGEGYLFEQLKKRVKPFLDKNDYLVPIFIDDPENFKLEKIA